MKYYLFAFFATFLWSAYFPAAKYASFYISSTEFAFLRFLSAFIFLSLYQIISSNLNVKNVINKYSNYFINKNSISKSNIDYKLIFLLILTGLIGITIHQYIQVLGINFTTATNTGWIIAFVPAITFILSIFILNEKSNFKKIIGIVIGFSGVIVIGEFMEIKKIFLEKEIFGNFLVFFTCFTWAFYTILSKKIFEKISPVDALPLIFLSGVIFLYIILIINNSEPFITFLKLKQDIKLIILLSGFLPAGIGYIFWFSAIDKIGASKTTFFVYLEPLMTTIISIIFLNEHFYIKHLISAVLIIIGLIIFEKS